MKNKELGYIVERFAENYLKNRGFNILNRNVHYWGGEIDIVALKEGVTHFIEVKCRKPGDRKDFDPISIKQIDTLRRSINIYLMNNFTINEWQLDLFVVYFEKNRVHDISIYEDITFDYDH